MLRTQLGLIINSSLPLSLRRVDNGSVWGSREGMSDGGLMMAILTVFDQQPTEEMVSTESDQRLLESDIGSNHSLIKVWTMV